VADFAQYLKEAREAAGLNQSELADEVGLTGSYISVLESRRKPPPSDKVLKRMAKALRKPERELLEVAHLDRTPDDIRKKIRALDRRLSVERKVTSTLLNDLLPSSLWHFGRVKGYPEYGLEKLRLDKRKKRILAKVIRRIGHLTSRGDFLEESRRVIDTLPAEDRAVLAEVLPELVRDIPEGATTEPAAGSPGADLSLPVLSRPPRKGARATPRATGTQPVLPDDHGPRRYFLTAADEDMSPRVEPGDLLLVAPDRRPEDGSLAVVRVGKRLTVREVHEARDDYLLVAASPAIKTTRAAASALVGVVLEIRRRVC
jgi:transcriptional regulator with XRE-family HTH domain